MQTKSHVTSRRELAQKVINWDSNEKRRQHMTDKLFNETPHEPNLEDTQKIKTFDSSIIFHDLGLDERSEEITKKVRSYDWLTDELITSKAQTEGHKPRSVMKDQVVRKEEPTNQYSFNLMDMMKKILSTEEFITFQQKFEELTQFKDSSVTVTGGETINSLEEAQRLLMEATDVLVIDHGWTGDKSMGTGQQKTEDGRSEEIVIAGNWLNALPKEKRSKAVAVSIDLLGQGKAKFIDGVKSFGPQENARAWNVIHSILQIVRSDRNVTLLGHSMGGGTDIYLAGEGYLPENCSIIPACPSYHQKDNPIDGNYWTNPSESQPIRIILDKYIKDYGKKLDLILKRTPFIRKTIAQKISEFLVEKGYLKGNPRKDLLFSHVMRFLGDPEAADITAKGSSEQQGISDEQWIKLNEKHMMILFGFEKDQMCDQYMTVANLPEASFFLRNDQFPPPYYIFNEGQHYSFAEIKYQRELNDLFELTNQLKESPASFKIFQELQYTCRQEFDQGNKNFQEFLNQLVKNDILLEKIKIALNFESVDQIKQYIDKRKQYSSENLAQFSHFSPAKMAELILSDVNIQETLSGERIELILKNTEHLEVILRTLDRYTRYAFYNNEQLHQKISERDQGRRLKVITRPDRQEDPNSSEEQQISVAGD